MNLEKVKKMDLTKSPGCYQFLNKSGEIIYVGKAANLRSRVLSYWRENAGHSPAKHSMMKQIEKIRIIETDSEIEALLLEANLIKKFQPQYNIVMRDDKRHIYIKISTEEKWPKIFATRQIDKSGKYYGPFVSSEAVRETLKVIRKIWPFRTCSNMPKKACLYYRIGKCPGMCEFEVNKNEYKKIIKDISLFLEGGKRLIIKKMESRKNELEKDLQNPPGAALQRRMNHSHVIQDEDEIELRQIKYRLLNFKKVLGQSNILSLIDKYATDVIELAKVLSLPRVPERIEGYDISNIFGRDAVGSMVVFGGGEPSKKDYRKFKIKIDEEGGDIGMLREVLERRFKRSLDVSLLDKRWPLPDLIIIDGGKAQLNLVLRILKKFKLDIPALAVSKGAGLRSAAAPDKIFFPGEAKPLELSLSSPALHLVKRVRDEAHRFAIKYHKDLRSKNLTKFKK